MYYRCNVSTTTPQDQGQESDSYGVLGMYFRAIKSVAGKGEDLTSKSGSPEDLREVVDLLKRTDFAKFEAEIAAVEIDLESQAEQVVTDAERRAEDAAREAEELRKRLALSQRFQRGLKTNTVTQPALNA